MKSKVIHDPIFDTQMICDYYTEKDGAKVMYVCTTDFSVPNVPVDVFYRRRKVKGLSRYFGLFINPETEGLMVTDLDDLMDFEIPMVKDDDGDYRYSRQESDNKEFRNGNFVAGGRITTRWGPKGILCNVEKGKFSLIKFPDQDEEHNDCGTDDCCGECDDDVLDNLAASRSEPEEIVSVASLATDATK